MKEARLSNPARAENPDAFAGLTVPLLSPESWCRIDLLAHLVGIKNKKK